MKKIVLLLVVASFFIASPVMAFNSSSLLNKCIEAEKFFQEIEADKTKALFCIGYLAAVVDTYESLKNRNKEPLFCLPRKHEELFVLTFVKFLKNNPDYLTYDPPISMIQSLIEAFPCSGQSIK
jgi:hypothetical protein